MYMYKHICIIYIYTYTCTYKYTYTCTCTYIHTYICTCIYIYTCTYICGTCAPPHPANIHIQVHAQIYIYMYMHIHTYIYMYMYIHIHIYVVPAHRLIQRQHHLHLAQLTKRGKLGCLLERRGCAVGRRRRHSVSVRDASSILLFIFLSGKKNRDKFCYVLSAVTATVFPREGKLQFFFPLFFWASVRYNVDNPPLATE